MKKLIFAATGLILCAAMFTGYKVYRNSTMTAQEKLLLANVEALTRGETLPEIPCSAADDSCTTTVKGSDGVLYSIEVEGMAHS
ncbi:MAG: hypothetical protein LBV41_13260 [Cytophagaceae bacterium]|jgi:hypothetical protein|nr:hypothetical protein [Cytophagaceae bacterium]